MGQRSLSLQLPLTDLHTRNQRASWGPQQQLLGIFLILPGVSGGSGQHRCGWKCGVGLADLRDAPWSCSQGRILCLCSASSSSLVHSPADPSLWGHFGSWNLWAGPLGAHGCSGLIPFPGSSIGSLVPPGASQGCTARASWGLGPGSSLAPTGTSEPPQAGDWDQPGSAAWAFPAPSCRIKGLGAASCSGVSRACRRRGWMGQELLQSRALTSP